MTEHVEAGDPRLDPYRRVGDPAWLVQQNLFVAEGRLVVSRLMAAGRFPVVSVLVTEAAFEALREPLSTVQAPVYVCDPGTLREVTVESLPRAIPDSIDVDVSALGIGDSIHVRDLTLPEGASILSDPDLAVASVVLPKAEEEKVVEAAPAEGEAAAPAEGAPAAEATES